MDHKQSLYFLMFIFLIGFASAVDVVNETIGAEPGVPYDLDIPTNCINPTCTFPDNPLFYFTNGSLIPYAENNTHYGTNSDCQVLPYSEYDNGTDIVDSPYTDQDNPVNWSVSYSYTCESTTSDTCTPLQFVMFNLLALIFPIVLILYVFSTQDKMSKIAPIAITLIIFTLVVVGILESIC